MIDDPIVQGLARGWAVTDASTLSADREETCDVVVVGTGAGGGVSAQILAEAGLSVVMIEEGALKSSRDFRMREAEAYPQLYQDSAARKSADKAITILQGRTVGGSTTVNWTSSFRTPPRTLAYWRERFGLETFTPEALEPWFEAMERRLGVSAWDLPPNENNALLWRGTERLGIPAATIRRNVVGCADLGYCGVGCPINAKQSMLVTTIPAALERGAKLYTRLAAERLELDARGATALLGRALDGAGLRPTGRTVRVRARHYVLAGAAIGTPAVLLRSGAPDPHGRLGRRTFLHPVVISAALMDQPVKAWAGAPQTIYSDHFLDSLPLEGPMGFKLEAPPLHPVILASTLHGFGPAHAALMHEFPRAHALLALLRDGFHPESPGGEVRLGGGGSPVLDYPLNAYLFDGVRRALLTMAEVQFAAGAREVSPVHEGAGLYSSWAQAKRAIESLPLEPLLVKIVSAHVMGGCGMGADPRESVVDPDGRHHQMRNVSVFDSSVFPTSVGANPQLSIFGIVARMASGLAAELSGRPQPAPA